MSLTVIINLVVCACATAGFTMGAHFFFGKQRPLYSKIVTIALGCAALGRLYNAVVIICDGRIPRTFNTGILATIGCFLVFFNANYGQMDSLCDYEIPKNRAVRWIALAAPILFAGCTAFLWISCKESIVLLVTLTVELLCIMLASYFNCKHLLIHDIKGGILASIRGYNLIVLFLEILYTAEIVCDAFKMTTPKSIIYLLMSLCLLLVIPVLKKGGKLWTI
jgi:xanthine/uracil/vitamin C permease (AzgA family)